jgi:hypothetical protein
MPRLLKRIAIFAGLFTPVALGAQTSATTLRAVNRVLEYRAFWVGDSTRVDACSLFQSLGQPTGFPAGINPQVAFLLDRASEPCADDPQRAARSWPRAVVRVDSVTAGDSVVRVRLTVMKGENVYREAYSVGALDRGGWIREVTVTGLMREYLIPPGRRRTAPGTAARADSAIPLQNPVSGVAPAAPH